MTEDEKLWIDSYGFVYSGDGKRLLKGTSVEGAYWIPEGVEEIEPGALIGCKIGTLHVPWTAHVHEYDQLVFCEDPEENEEMMPAVYFGRKNTLTVTRRLVRLRMKGSIVLMSMVSAIVWMVIGCCLRVWSSRRKNIVCQMA